MWWGELPVLRDSWDSCPGRACGGGEKEVAPSLHCAPKPALYGRVALASLLMYGGEEMC